MATPRIVCASKLTAELEEEETTLLLLPHAQFTVTGQDWVSKLFGVGLLILAFRLFILSLTIVLLFTLSPTPAYACDGIVCLGDWFGWTDVAKIHSERDKQLADIEAKKAADVARINADAQDRIAQANRQIEEQRVQGLINQAQAKAMADAFAATVNAKRDEYVASITQNAQVAIAGINQTGETERSRIAWDGKGNMLAIAIIGVIVLAALGIVGRLLILHTQRSLEPPQINVLLANPHQADRTIDVRRQQYLTSKQPFLIEESEE